MLYFNSDSAKLTRVFTALSADIVPLHRRGFFIASDRGFVVLKVIHAFILNMPTFLKDSKMKHTIVLLLELVALVVLHNQSLHVVAKHSRPKQFYERYKEEKLWW